MIRLCLRYDLQAEAAAVPRLYAALLRHAALAEARGVALAWISERPFGAAAAIPAALPLCAAVAAATSTLRIGVGPLALPIHHPVRVAEDAASLDGISGGRLELALGLGASEDAFRGFGIPTRGRGGRLEEGVALLRAAWTGQPIHFQGVHHTVSGVTVSPQPFQPGGPPLFIAAGAGPAVRRAARLGTGLLATAPQAVRAYAAAASAGGGSSAPRAALLLDAVAARSERMRGELRSLAALEGLAGLDLVVGAGADGRFLDADELDALLRLRDTLESGRGGPA